MTEEDGGINIDYEDPNSFRDDPSQDEVAVKIILVGDSAVGKSK